MKKTKQNGNGSTAILEEQQKLVAQSRRVMDSSVAVELPEMEGKVVSIHIKGETPLIVHNWSPKAIRMMLDKQMGKASKGRENKDPFEDFKYSLYPLEDKSGRYGLPAPAFKAAMVTAANDIKLKMTEMRRAFHVNFYRIPIIGVPITEPQTEWDVEYAEKLKPYHAQGISMRMDLVRLETGVADLRFRAWYPQWSCDLEIKYFPPISLEQLTMLARCAGRVGVGEWRPGAPQCKSGEYGRFDVA